MGVEIEVVRTVSGEITEAFRRLLPQLSRSAAPLDTETLQALADHPANRLLVARAGGEILGTLTLVAFPIPTGVRAWIEDVVVDSAARGQGIGAALVTEAVELARAAGARTVDLTSRPSREAANRLYQRLGFTQRSTNLYRIAT
jgi:ribosomal protein S18 acetylase RimI-like enzyme